jgi:hypothetical protein
MPSLPINSDPKGLIMLIPVAILLIIAFIKRNIFIACTWASSPVSSSASSPAF